MAEPAPWVRFIPNWWLLTAINEPGAGPRDPAHDLQSKEDAMKVSDAMHRTADWANADTKVAEIARLMAKDDIGAVPIGDNDKLVGMLTDRDIAVRVVAKGLDPKRTTAAEVMSKGVVWCPTNATVEDAIHLMDQKKIRRLPVIDEKKRLVGMLSLGDIAHSVSRELSGEILHSVADHHA
jgi:CBS domain-containing protein